MVDKNKAVNCTITKQNTNPVTRKKEFRFLFQDQIQTIIDHYYTNLWFCLSTFYLVFTKTTTLKFSGKKNTINIWLVTHTITEDTRLRVWL